MRMRATGRGWIGIAVLLCAVLGMAIPAAGAPAPDPNSYGRAIRIYSPYAGGPAVAGDHLLVQVTIAEFRLDALGINGPAMSNSGYWVLQIDGAFAGLAVSDMIMAPNAALPRLAAGPHHLRVELVDSRGASLNPPVADEM